MKRFTTKVQLKTIFLAVLFLAVSHLGLSQLKLRAIPTFENMSIEFDASGGLGSKSNTATLQYRRAGSGTWMKALDLFYNNDTQEYAGSVVNLQSNTQYEFKVTLDSGESGMVKEATWSENFPVGERIYLPKSSNKTLKITESGSPGAYKLYTFDPSVGSAIIDTENNQKYNIEIGDNVGYIIIRGLTLRRAIENNISLGQNNHDIIIEDCDLSLWGRRPNEGTTDGSIKTRDLPSNASRIIIQGNNFHNPNYSSYSWEQGHPQGASALLFWESKGNHVIRYNTMQGSENKYLAYGIRGAHNYSYIGGYGSNTDIYNNYISYTWAGAIECEGGNKNNRIYENFIENTFSNINASVASVGPLYIFKNITGRSRMAKTVNNSDDWGASAFLKTGGNNTYEVKKIYLFNNVNLQPPPVGGGTGFGSGASNGWSDAGAQTANGEPRNMVVLNNIFLRRTGNPKHSIGELKSGSECTNIIDYNMFLGSVPGDCGDFQKNGISLSANERPKWDAGNGSNSGEFLNRKTLTGKFYLAAGAPGQGDATPIPNFLDGPSVDMGPHQRGEAPMKFGHKAFNNDNVNTPDPVNTAPVISQINDQTISKGEKLDPLKFTITDKESTPDKLILSTHSDNQQLVKDSSIAIAGNGENRTLVILPEAGQVGAVKITLTVSDGKAKSVEEFVLTINDTAAKNSPPTISSIEDQTINIGQPSESIVFIINDKESAVKDLKLSATSGNKDLVQNEGIVISGSGNEKTLNIYPVEGQTGSAKIVITVSDGDLEHNETFLLTVNDAEDEVDDNIVVPTISSIPDKTIQKNNILGPISFTIKTETSSSMKVAAVTDLTLTAASSNEKIVKNENIVIEGTGSTKELHIIPNKDQIGTTTISITVSDGKVSSSENFKLTVLDNSNLLVESFTLVNAETNKDILTIRNGSEINLLKIEAKKFNIRANTSKSVTRVVFGLDNNANFREESSMPYALFGDNQGNYNEASLSLGNHVLRATPFLGKGVKGEELMINFSVVNEVEIENPVPGDGLPSITSFTLVNAESNEDITTLKNGDVVNLTTFSEQKVNIRANTTSEVHDVVFHWNGQNGYRKEGQAPYTLFGDSGGNYNGKELKVGKYTLEAISYSKDDKASGLKIEFEVINQKSQEEIDSKAITSFTLVNAKTNKDITTLRNGDVINLATFLNHNVNIRANTSGNIHHVVFNWNGENNFRKEGQAPYALFGDSGGNYNGKELKVGKYTLEATSYSKNDKASGLKIEFEVINQKPQEETHEKTITSFTLVNAKTNKDITTLRNGDVINLATFLNHNVNIRANISGKIHHVVFNWNGEKNFRKEGQAPYALFGDSNGIYNGRELKVGKYSITAIPYIDNDGQIMKEAVATVNFEVINDQFTQGSLNNINIYPNPFIGEINIDLNEGIINGSGERNLLIFNNLGTIVYRTKVKLNANGSHINIDLSGADLREDETYFLKIEGIDADVVRILKK